MPENKRELAFLSYAHDDLDRVRMVYEGLKKRKVDGGIKTQDGMCQQTEKVQ